MKTKKLKILLLSIMLVSMTFQSYSAVVASEYKHERTSRKTDSRVIRGITVTGINDVLGSPAYDWGPPFGTFGFVTLGIYNEFGSEPFPLSESVPDNAIVATAIDPMLLASTGVSPDELEPGWINVPLRDVPVQVAFGVEKTFPGIATAHSSAKAQAEPVNPITIGQWMKASGVAKITCFDDNTSKVKLRMRNLIPNRLYGVWATLGQSVSGEAEVFPSIPIGGTPNLFITDEDGDAKYERTMQFCPLKPETTDRSLLVINVQYHSNHQNYGGINGPPRELGGYWIGSRIHHHLHFPVNVELINK